MNFIMNCMICLAVDNCSYARSLLFSIAGNAPPASCVFSQVMNMAAFVGMNGAQILSEDLVL